MPAGFKAISPDATRSDRQLGAAAIIGTFAKLRAAHRDHQSSSLRIPGSSILTARARRRIEGWKTMARHPLKGSTKALLPDAQVVGQADPAERLEVSIRLRRKDQAGFESHLAAITAGGQPISRESYADLFGADPADVAAVEDFAAAHGLHTVQKDHGRRTVVLSGTVAQFNEAFGVDLKQVEHDGGTYRGREGDILLPDTLADKVEAVLGLDDRPVARPHFRRHQPPGNVLWHAVDNTQATSFPPTQVASFYQFPNGAGAGQTVALIELGGGYRSADLTAYFKSLGVKKPKVTAVSVDHGKNSPTGDANGPDGEVLLDIEVVGAVAPGAHIVVYFTPNTDAGFLDAITSALHDQTYKPSVISISWGGPESSWTQQALTSYDQAFQSAAALGVTVIVASGDNGSSDGVKGAGNNVDFPASSPHVLGAGGTHISVADGKITAEAVWNDGANGGAGGGGVSAVFALPSWQQGLQVTATGGGKTPLTKRGVPDICGDADPESGYVVRVDGSNTVIGGTSAVAPLWAGLIAIINAQNGRPVGFANPTLYKNPNAMNDVTQGNNGAFQAASGWDAATGLGSPNGGKIAALFASQTMS
jgi:kumamolisin